MQGSCLCRDVRFEVSGRLGVATNCHCSICRKFHGSAFATHGVVPLDEFRWLGGEERVRRFESSPGAQRSFCERCGSNVPATLMPGLVFVPLGNVEGDPGIQPIANIFVGSKACWYDIRDGLMCHDQYQPGFDTPVVPDRPRSDAPSGYLGGSCLCGKVAYHVEGGIELIRHCHCSRCRKARSAAHATNGFVDPARFHYVRGADLLASYKIPEAERFTQTFCRECSSPMPHAVPNRPYVLIPMGSVDDEPGSRPREHIFVGSKAPWYEIRDALPQHDEYAPQ